MKWTDRAACETREEAIKLVAAQLADVTRARIDYDIDTDSFRDKLQLIQDFAQKFDIPFSIPAHIEFVDKLGYNPPSAWQSSSLDC